MSASPRMSKIARRRWRQGGVVLGVGLAHVAAFIGLSRSSGDLVLPPPAPVIEVVLYDPPARPPPEPEPAPPADDPGGGAPAAPSVVRFPPDPPPTPPEVYAPPTPAPEQPPLVVGVSDQPADTPAQGQGGEGTGTGGGQGSGAGPGAGSERYRLLRGPSRAEIVRRYPAEALRARRPGHADIACRIRLDTRLEACRVVAEDPPGQGFGPAALQVADSFRFRPPFEDGRPIDGREVVLGVDFFPR